MAPSVQAGGRSLVVCIDVNNSTSLQHEMHACSVSAQLGKYQTTVVYINLPAYFLQHALVRSFMGPLVGSFMRHVTFLGSFSGIKCENRFSALMCTKQLYALHAISCNDILGSYHCNAQCLLSHMRPFLFDYHISLCYFLHSKWQGFFNFVCI